MKKQKFDKIYQWGLKNNRIITVTFELTSLCNWRCKHCYITDYSNQGLEKDKIFEILAELRKQNAFDVIFTGGEVLLRDDLLDIVLFARKLGFRVSILSNASLLTEELAKAFSEAYISNFSSTIFSLDENIHDEITSTKGSLKATLRGLYLLKKYGISIEVKTPILQSNNNSYKKVAEFAERNGFEYTCSPIIYPTMNGNKATLKLGMNNKTLAKQIWNIDSLMKYTKNIVTEEKFLVRLCYIQYIFHQMVIYIHVAAILILWEI